MARHNQKLPDSEKLIEHLLAGMDRHTIAIRYNVQVGTVRQRFANLDMIGIEREIMSSRQPEPKPAPPLRPGTRIASDRIVITRAYSAGELGGSILRSISLPRVSYHAAYLREAGRC
jgi:hypothetical protein